MEMWTEKLKNCKEVVLRYRKIDDSDKLFQMFSSMSKKSLEWTMTPYTMEVIKRWNDSLPDLIPLVAEYEGKIVGHAVLHKFPRERRKGIGEFAIVIHDDFQNVGLGTAMTKRILRLAEKQKMHRIELKFVAENKIALHLYEKFGFQIEGTHRDDFYGCDGMYHDTVSMGLLLRNPRQTLSS